MHFGAYFANIDINLSITSKLLPENKSLIAASKTAVSSSPLYLEGPLSSGSIRPLFGIMGILWGEKPY